MIISDLNYLEVANEEVVGGIFLGALSGSASTNLTVTETVNITKVASSNVSVNGVFVSAQGEVIGINDYAIQAFGTVTPGYGTGTVIILA